jgi:hypothetical protein
VRAIHPAPEQSLVVCTTQAYPESRTVADLAGLAGTTSPTDWPRPSGFSCIGEFASQGIHPGSVGQFSRGWFPPTIATLPGFWGLCCHRRWKPPRRDRAVFQRHRHPDDPAMWLSHEIIYRPFISLPPHWRNRHGWRLTIVHRSAPNVTTAVLISAASGAGERSNNRCSPPATLPIRRSLSSWPLGGRSHDRQNHRSAIDPLVERQTRLVHLLHLPSAPR